MEVLEFRKMKHLNPFTGTDPFNLAPMNSTDPYQGRRFFLRVSGMIDAGSPLLLCPAIHLRHESVSSLF
jgi:hypothetical protein